MGAAAFEPWVDGFLGHLRNERRLSVHTVSSYRRDLEAMQKFCCREGLDGWPAVDTLAVRRFAAAQHRAGLAARSIQRRLSALRTFFAYQQREGRIRNNPATGVGAPRPRRRLPATLDVDTMAALLAFGDDDDALAVRDRAIMELLYSCGLRLAELVALDLKALDLADRTLRVTGKGDKTRVVPVGATAIARLQAWLKMRAQLAAAPCEAVFVGRRGRRLGARAVQSRIRYWARRQGIDASVYPHLFRHSFASHMLESSGDLRGVQELLGHANISTTQVYTHLDFQHLADTYDRTHPRARRKGPDAKE